MKRLEHLPEITARQLGGLEATPTLLAKIKLEAAEHASPRRGMTMLRPVMAICAALVLCLCLSTLLDDGAPVRPGEMPNVMDSHSAGTAVRSAPEPAVAADMPAGAITMSAGVRGTAQTLFAAGSGNSFPLITLNGATYRMLHTPDALSQSLLGESLGTVTEFNVEPALGSGGVVSNAVSVGDSVCGVSGMQGALVAAPVDGALRVFQRVSYAGKAVIGDETLADTLCRAHMVEWIEVEGMGRVDDAGMAQYLMGTLLDFAQYEAVGMSGSGSMQIGLNNGLVLQLMVGDDTVSACGTWSCPDFFEAFAEAVK